MSWGLVPSPLDAFPTGYIAVCAAVLETRLAAATGSPQLPGLLERLRRRKIVQWLLGYLAAGWLLLQLNDVLASVWDVPLSTQWALSLALGLGILPALIVAWYHGERGRQEVCCAELVLVGLTAVMTVATVWQVCFP